MFKFVKKNRNIAYLLAHNKESSYKLGKRLASVCSRMNTKDIRISTFYINKMTKVRSKFKKKEGKYRTIRYLVNKDNRKIAKVIALILESTIPNKEYMHGFLTGKGIYTFRKQSKAEHYLKIDLSNAFEQISANWVYTYFRKVCDLNKKDAEFLTKISTYNGKVYQGCPFSPILFNAYYANAINTLNKLGHIRTIAYADDILVMSDIRISWKMMRLIHKILKSNGLKPNPKKCRFNSTDEVYYLGLNLKKNKIRQGQKTRKRIKHTTYNLFNLDHGENSEYLYQKAKGLKGWYQSGFNLGTV